MDENCWTVAKALARNSFVFQGSVERVAKTHFTGCEHAFFLVLIFVPRPARQFSTSGLLSQRVSPAFLLLNVFILVHALSIDACLLPV